MTAPTPRNQKSQHASFESPLDSEGVTPVHPKDQPWILLEELMLKLQSSGHLTQRAHSLEKTLMLGKTEDKRRRGRQRRRGFQPWVRMIPWRKAWQSTPVFLSGDSHGWRISWTEKPGGIESTGLHRAGQTEVTEHAHTVALYLYFKSASKKVDSVWSEAKRD